MKMFRTVREFWANLFAEPSVRSQAKTFAKELYIDHVVWCGDLGAYQDAKAVEKSRKDLIRDTCKANSTRRRYSLSTLTPARRGTTL